MSDDGQTLLAIHKSAYIANNAKVSGPGVWLSTDGGATFTKQTVRAGAGSTWDVAIAGDASLMIASEDSGGYKPYLKASTSPTWTAANVPNGAWRSAAVSQDGSIAALCEQDTGIYVSRDSGATFGVEISNVQGEGCGPMAISSDGNTIAIGRFAHPDKKVFNYANSVWNLVSTITGVSSWHSTASVSISGDGQVITIGDYLSSPEKISFSTNGGVDFDDFEFESPGFLPSGEAFVSRDGTKVFSINFDGLYLLDLAPAGGVNGSSEPAVSVPYTGPLVTTSARPATAGGEVTLNGSGLDQVTQAETQGKPAELIAVTESSLTIKLPRDLASGTHDLTLRGGFGTLTVQDALEIKASVASSTVASWTTRLNPDEVRMLVKNPIGKGRVQFMHNGREVASFETLDATDPGLVLVSSGEMAGTSYLLRTITLAPGKNALEIFVDGVRIWRAAYTGR
jgi:hypothetical protein